MHVQLLDCHLIQEQGHLVTKQIYSILHSQEISFEQNQRILLT